MSNTATIVVHEHVKSRGNQVQFSGCCLITRFREHNARGPAEKELSRMSTTRRLPAPLPSLPRRRRTRGRLDGGQSLGRPPGVVDCAVYEQGVRKHGSLPHSEAMAAARDHGDAFVWIGLYQPSEAEFADIAAEFSLHPLAVEDAVKAHQRPKLERYGDTLFAVFKTARYVEHEVLTGTSEVIETGEVMVFVGAEFVVTVRHGQPGSLAGVRQAREARPELMRIGPAAVLYAIADRVVDDDLAVADALQDDIDEVEAAVFSPRATDSQRVYQLKRELLEFKRAVLPLARPLQALTGAELPLIPAEARQYFRDVEDHLERVAEQVAGFDELLTGILNATLTQVGIQQNNDMRKISAWVAIGAIPTAIAAIYGMNFEHMPELHWMYGYPIMIGVTLTLCVLLYLAFRRSGWL
jgi:magnesium transporter